MRPAGGLPFRQKTQAAGEIFVENAIDDDG